MGIRRVVYVVPKSRFFRRGPGGGVTHACGVASGLAECGVDVTVVSGPGTSAHMGDGVEVVEVEASGGRMAWERNLLGAVEAVSSEADACVVRYSVANAWRFARVMRQAGDRDTVWCFEVNSLLYHQGRSTPHWIRKMWLPVERRVIDAADLVYAVSNVLERDLAPHVSSEVVVIPNGGPPPWSPPISDRPGADGRIRFCYFGRLTVYYEYGLVMEALDHVRRKVSRPVELHLYGDGPEYDRTRRRVRGMTGVYCHGRYDGRQLENMDTLNDTSVLILPYTGTEGGAIGSPTKLYEYMAMGGAIIAARVGDLERELRDGEDALLYESGDLESLTEAMLLLVEDSGLRARLGRDVQRKYARTATWPRRMEALVSALENRACRHGAPSS